MYASFVKKLYVDLEDYHLLRRIAKAMPSPDLAHMFPRVDAVDLMFDFSEPIDDIVQYFSNRLDSLHVFPSNRYNSQPIHFLSTALSRSSINLGSLSLMLTSCWYPDNTVACRYIASVVEASPALQSLRIYLSGSLSLNLLRTISRLQRLDSLALSRLSNHAIIRAEEEFPLSLKSLDITGDLRSCCAIVRVAQVKRLEMLFLTGKERESEVGDSLQAVGLCVSLTLLHLHLDADTIQWDDLRPLLRCTRLRRISISTIKDNLNIDDGMLSEMARAWSEVRDLTLTKCSGERSEGVAPVATLGGLECFAAHCPHLTRLAVNVDARAQTGGTSYPIITSPLPSLTTLYFESSISGDRQHARDIARTVDALWPGLRFMCDSWSEHPEEREYFVGEESTWGVVWDIVAERQNVRRSLEEGHRE